MQSKYKTFNDEPKCKRNVYQPLVTVRPIYRTGTPLSSKHPILYIFSTNIRTELFEHAA
jgi:hypothetical protein